MHEDDEEGEDEDEDSDDDEDGDDDGLDWVTEQAPSRPRGPPSVCLSCSVVCVVKCCLVLPSVA